MQHQVDGVALRDQQVARVAEGVEHHHQHRGLACGSKQHTQAFSDRQQDALWQTPA
jgi:hypothetical protein